LAIQNFTKKIDLYLNQPRHRNIVTKETIYMGWKKLPRFD